MRILTCIDAPDRALGRPVQTADQVTVRECLRLARTTRPLPGPETLFR